MSVLKKNNNLVVDKPPSQDITPFDEVTDVKKYVNRGDITKEKVDQIATLLLEHHLDLPTACDRVLVDHSDITELRILGADASTEGLERYTCDRIRWAEAESHKRLVTLWLEGSAGAQEFLKATKKRYQRKMTLHVQYEVAAILNIVANVVGEQSDTYLNIVDQVQRLSGPDVIELLDHKAGLLSDGSD